MEHTEMREVLSPREHSLTYHHKVHTISDRVARGTVLSLRFFADLFFGHRYGHRAVVLETVAAVPGMVGGMLQHLRSLRLLCDDHGWIKTLLDEAENERMHLLVYSEIAMPNYLERLLIILTQFGFYMFYLLLYIASPRTAHRMVGYLEEEAIKSYTEYLEMVTKNPRLDIKAPALAIEYWNLSSEARLSDVIRVTRQDEINHRDVNHAFADKLNR